MTNFSEVRIFFCTTHEYELQVRSFDGGLKLLLFAFRATESIVTLNRIAKTFPSDSFEMFGACYDYRR